MRPFTKTKSDLRLRLYVTGNAPNSLRAIANIGAICDKHFSSRYALEIVDLIEQPGRAAADQVIVTPTLIRLAPKPMGRVIGSLSDTEQVLLALGVK